MALSLAPTLVFTIVLAGILKERFGIPDYLYGALIVYALLNTVFPGFLLNGPSPEYDAPHIPREDEPRTSILDEEEGASGRDPSS